eukprot:614724_1
MILLLLASFHWVLLVAVNEVTQFDFLTHSLKSSGSKNNFIITLWFNHTIYQNQFNSPSESDTWFQAYKDTSNPRFSILGSSHCNPESKIMFEQISGGDSLKVNTIQFYTESGDFYAIRKHKKDGVTKEYICIDAVGTTCDPPKQMFYFDISRPNTYIEDAVYMDATSVTPQIETCEPTASPSNHLDPTKSVSNEPSMNPSSATANPSSNLSIAPSDTYPTESSTRDPFEYEQTEHNVDIADRQKRSFLEIIMICVIGVVLLACIICVFCWIKRRKKLPKDSDGINLSNATNHVVRECSTSNEMHVTLQLGEHRDIAPPVPPVPEDSDSNEGVCILPSGNETVGAQHVRYPTDPSDSDEDVPPPPLPASECDHVHVS